MSRTADEQHYGKVVAAIYGLLAVVILFAAVFLGADREARRMDAEDAYNSAFQSAQNIAHISPLKVYCFLHPTADSDQDNPDHTVTCKEAFGPVLHKDFYNPPD